MMNEHIQDLLLVDIDPGDNDRETFDQTGLEELAASIRDHGLAEPIIVRQVGERFEIVAGERRWRAHQIYTAKVKAGKWHKGPLVKLGRIKAIIRELSDEQASGIMLLENIHRAELNAIEEARAYQKRMQAFGWDAGRLAREANVPEQRVRLRLTLLDTVPEAQALIRAGQMGIKYAYALRDLDSNRQRIALRYLSEVDTPRLREFRQLCAKLLAEQAQESLFNMARFMTEVQDTRTAEAEQRPERVIPISESLPPVRKARTVGQALERYIRDLLDSENLDAAQAVGTFYRGLLEHGLIRFPKGASPLISGESLQDRRGEVSR